MKLFITIDTEMDANIHWEKNWPAEYSSIYEGVQKLFRPLWSKYGAHPIYFISPEILYDEKCVDILKKELAEGATAGAHLHPEYIQPGMEIKEGRQVGQSTFPCNDYSNEVERAKLLNLTELIEAKLGSKPIWYRAARFGADMDTYKMLDEMGYLHESSVTPGIDWSDRGGIDYRTYPHNPYRIENTNLTEHPVTICGKRFGIFGKLLPDNWLFYSWLRPTHMTYIEMRHIIKSAVKEGREELVMMFHSMEPMIGKTPYVRNKLMQDYYMWRLDKTLNYAKKMGIEF